MPERKPPTKIFSKKELKKSRIDRRYRKGAIASITEDLGTHFEKRELSFPKDLDVKTTVIPKGRSQFHQPIHIGDAFTIIHYTDTGNIFCYDGNKRFIGRLYEHDLARQCLDILKFLDSISIDYVTGRLSIKKGVADYIRRDYRNKLSSDFMKKPTFTAIQKIGGTSNKSKTCRKTAFFSRKTANYKYIHIIRKWLHV